MTVAEQAREALGLLNEHQAADVLGVKVATLRRWRREGIGPVYSKPPGSQRPLYTLQRLRDWIEGQQA